jgi:hypothetical protein
MGLTTRKCHHCGITDSIHRNDIGRSRLRIAIGPVDETNGLQIYFVYCRKCKHMNIYSPGWFGNHKHVETWAPEDIRGRYQTLKNKALLFEPASGVQQDTQARLFHELDEALMEDGVY